MSEDPEVTRLRRELKRTKRELAQVERVAATSHDLAEQSKRIMLASHHALQQHVEELREAKLAADRATHAKGRFLAMMSHELRTPLNGIIGSAELLMQAKLAPEHTELAGMLQRSGSALLSIVNDVLDYSRVEAGALAIERIPFSLAHVVKEVVGLQASVAAQKNLELTTSFVGRVPDTVSGDPSRLRQVLLNLLTNALKFTTKGSITIVVQPGALVGEILFSVCDTGIGIAPEAKARLFRAFEQEDVSTTRRFGGTGLGLAICKQLVELMGGNIDVLSEPGGGSNFSFTCMLPATDRETSERDAGTDDKDLGVGMHVLIVDDHDANRLLMRTMLKRVGCTTEEACDGMEALQCIADHDFDLVLMDINMPIMNGYDAARAIRAMNSGKSAIQILALTANAMPEDRERCLAVGMNGYLSKPVRMRDLQAGLRDIRSQTSAQH